MLPVVYPIIYLTMEKISNIFMTSLFRVIDSEVSIPRFDRKVGQKCFEVFFEDILENPKSVT